eukprot:558304-Amphidinium_carterae.1
MLLTSSSTPYRVSLGITNEGYAMGALRFMLDRRSETSLLLSSLSPVNPLDMSKATQDKHFARCDVHELKTPPGSCTCAMGTKMRQL